MRRRLWVAPTGRRILFCETLCRGCVGANRKKRARSIPSFGRGAFMVRR